MCGRFTLTAPPEAVKAFFGAAEAHAAPPRHNIAPTQPILIAREDLPGVRRLVLARWGLIPGWVKDPATVSLMFNARAETAADKPSFRGSMRHKRCLIPASGFYEWQKRKGGKSQPFLLQPPGGGLVAFAGLWEDWSAPDGGVMETATILTTAANAALAPIHDRMPAVIAPEDFAAWLDTRTVTAAEAAKLLRPAPDATFEAVPVGERVNAVKNDDAGVREAAEIDPAPAEEAPGRPAKDKAQFDLFG